MNKGKLIIYSGPSGAGKGTLRESIVENPKYKLGFSVSWTTRNKRSDEVNGEHYHFVSKEQFLKGIDDNKFLEWEEYAGNYYGTPIGPVLEKLDQGFNVLLEIEIKGQKQVVKKIPDAVTIFILPPHMEELRRRLSARNTEDQLTLETRINIAELEITEAKQDDLYKYFVVNDDLETAKSELAKILDEELL